MHYCKARLPAQISANFSAIKTYFEKADPIIRLDRLFPATVAAVIDFHLLFHSELFRNRNPCKFPPLKTSNSRVKAKKKDPNPAMGVMELYSTIAETIYSFTGLSPAALFTILSLMFGVYHMVCGMFVSPEEETKAAAERSLVPPEPEIPLEPVEIGEVTIDELRAYEGSDPKKPLLMAIKGNIYDVSKSRVFYGPGGPYALFAGRESSRALALMSFDHNDLTGNLDGLSAPELEVLQDWEEKFKEKYVKVGQLVSEITSTDKNQSNEKLEALK